MTAKELIAKKIESHLDYVKFAVSASADTKSAFTHEACVNTCRELEIMLQTLVDVELISKDTAEVTVEIYKNKVREFLRSKER